MDTDGFFYAEIDGKFGLVPSNFLQELPQSHSPLHPPKAHDRQRRPSSGHARPRASPGPPVGHAPKQGQPVNERPRSQPHQQPMMSQQRPPVVTNQNQEQLPINGGARHGFSSAKPAQAPTQVVQQRFVSPQQHQTLMHQNQQQFQPIMQQKPPPQQPQQQQQQQHRPQSQPQQQQQQPRPQSKERVQITSQPLVRPSPQPRPQAQVRAPVAKKASGAPLMSGSAPVFYLPPSHSQVRPTEAGKPGAGVRPRK